MMELVSLEEEKDTRAPSLSHLRTHVEAAVHKPGSRV